MAKDTTKLISHLHASADQECLSIQGTLFKMLNMPHTKFCDGGKLPQNEKHRSHQSQGMLRNQVFETGDPSVLLGEPYA